jgi:hypothetical protein
MSKWYRAKKEDIDIDGEDLNILVCTDYDGNIYVELSMRLLKEILQEKNKTINDLLKELNK